MGEEKQFKITAQSLDEIKTSKSVKVLLPSYVEGKRFSKLLSSLRRNIKRDQDFFFIAESKVYELLASDFLKHPVRIEWLPMIEEKELPKSRDIDEVIWQKMNVLYSLLIEYHNKPVITDDFEDHLERTRKRHIWFKLLDGMFYDVLRQTKLARSHIFSIFATVEGVKTAIEKTSQKNEKTETLLALLEKLDTEVFVSKAHKSWRYYDLLQGEHRDGETPEEAEKMSSLRSMGWTDEERLEFAYTINPILAEVLKEIEEIFS